LERCHDGRFELSVHRGSEPAGRVTYMFADAAKMCFDSDWFDRITCLSTIEHITEDAEVAREMGRILKPGGLLVVTTAVGPELREECIEEPTHDRRRLVSRVYSRETLFSRIVKPSGLRLQGNHDLTVPNWARRKRHQCPGQDPEFVSVALFLTKD